MAAGARHAEGSAGAHPSSTAREKRGQPLGRMSSAFASTVQSSYGDMSEATVLLAAVKQGDPGAAGRLLDLAYNELRRLAAYKLAQEPPGQTLQPTALVH